MSMAFSVIFVKQKAPGGAFCELQIKAKSLRIDFIEVYRDVGDPFANISFSMAGTGATAFPADSLSGCPDALGDHFFNPLSNCVYRVFRS